MKGFGIFLLNLCLLHVSVRAQQQLLFNINQEEGLPANEVHASFQDAHGFMWFATSSGIARYDGKNFLIFDADNGFAENSVLNFFPLSDHSVWVYTLTHSLYEFDPLAEKFIFKPFRFNEQLKAEIESQPVRSYVRQMTVGSDSLFYFTFLTSPGYIQLNPSTGETISRYRDYGNQLNIRYSNLILTYHEAAGFPYTYFATPEPGQSGGNFFVQRNGRYYFPEKEEPGYYNYQFGVADFCERGDTTLIVAGNYLVISSPDSVDIKTLESLGLSVNFRSEGGAFVGTFSGIEEFDRNFIRRNRFLENEIITCIFQDRHDLNWFCSHHRGIYTTLPSRLFTLFDSDKAPVSDVVFGPSGILVINPERTVRFYENAQDRDPDLFTETSYSRNKIFSSVHAGLDPYLGPELAAKTSEGSSYSPLLLDDTLVLNFLSNHLGFVTEDTVFSIPIDFGSEILSNHKVNDSTLFLGSRRGLMKLTNFEKLEKISLGNGIDQSAIHRVISFGNYLLLAVENRGVAVLKDERLWMWFNQQSGLLSNTVLDIATDQDQNIWIATKKGLNLALVKDNALAGLISFTSLEGLPDDCISAVTLHKDTVWLSTPRGVCFFEKNAVFTNTKQSSFFLDSVVVNGARVLNNQSTFDVPYNSQISVHIGYLLLPSQKNCVLEYKLSNQNSDWLLMENDRVDFRADMAGIIGLSVRARSFNVTLNQMQLRFQTAGPFWQSTWFIALMILLGLAYLVLMIFVARFLANRRQKRELEKTKLELKALIAQMNPHFMFNTMNSIQSYVINHNVQEAVLYLSDFALLIRKTLDFSRVEAINLDEELSFLKLYMELERKRFKNHIDFQVELNLLHEKKPVRIPPLMLQPIVENSLVHGLPGVLEGVIRLTIKEEIDHVVISISDNGKGEVQKHPIAKKTSVGMAILRDRVRLNNRKRYQESDFRQGFELFEGTKGWCTQMILYT